MDFVNGLYVKRYKYFRLKWKLLLIFVIVLLLQAQEAQSKHHLKSAVFHKLTVSIHRSIPEDEQLLLTLQNVLTEANKIFHQITKNVILAETIQIVIPHSWKYPASGKSYNVEDLSDIRIENYHLGAGRKVAVHTVQSEECDHHGDYITMRPDFLHNQLINQDVTSLVQEIIRYKYGILDRLDVTKDLFDHHEKLQEMICQGKKGWEILKKRLEAHNGSKHKSFRTKKEFKNPTYEILKTEPGNAYMFLIDNSKEFWNKTAFLPSLLNNLTDFATHYAPKESFISYTVYSDGARTVKNLAEIWNDTTLGIPYAEHDNEDKGDHQNLTAGLETCLQQLKESDLPTLGARVILVTDKGWDVSHSESAEYMHKLEQQLIDNGVLLHTLVIDGNPHHHHQKLQKLSYVTRGQFYMMNHETDIFRHGIIMLAPLAAENIMVISDEVAVKAIHLPLKHEIYIESGMENASEIYISRGSKPISSNIKVIDPQGVSVNRSQNSQRFGEHLSLFEANQAGKWSVQVTEIDKEKKMKFLVQVLSRSTENPVQFSAWIKQLVPEKPTVEIFALIKSINKLHHLKITAEVINHSRNSTHIVLKDSGIGADVISGDGIYSAYFVHFQGNGRYEVHVRVSGKQSINKTESHVEKFHRYMYAGTFWVHSKNSNNPDTIPPAPIRDLSVTNHSMVNGKYIIQLNWTAVGDNMDYGKVASYELRLTSSHRETSFEKWHRIRSSDVLEGSLAPLPSGHAQNVTFAAPLEMLKSHKSETIKIALKSHDHNNNSAPSNVEVIHVSATVASGSAMDRSELDHPTNETSLSEDITPLDNNTKLLEEENGTTTSVDNVSTSLFTTSHTESNENFIDKVNEEDLNQVTGENNVEIYENVSVFISPKVKMSFTKAIQTNFNRERGKMTTNSDQQKTTEHGYVLKNPANKVSDIERKEDTTASNNYSTEDGGTRVTHLPFAQINMRTSTIVASFCAGISGTFFVMVIVAAYVKNKKKKERTYNIGKSEQDFMERVALKDSAL